MSLKAGIVGLPNVGKSTLFNALLSRQVADAQNYPFCTIEPNTGVVEVPDKRLAELAKVVHTDKIVPAAIEFVDIAGLVEGAHRGEGLGNQFLAHIREVDLIIYVLRDFADPNVVRAGSRSPIDDLTVLRTELALADLGTLEKQKAPRANATPEEQERWPVIEKLRPQLEQLDLKKTVDLTADERVLVRSFSLLTLKPSLLVINVDEDALSVTVATDDPSLAGGLENADTAIRLCAKLEAQMADLAPDEKQELLQAYGVNEPILDKLIRSTYRELGLITFLTAGEKEARAWPILAGTRAPQAAGTIYSDFETGFIRAKVADYDDFITDGGWLGLKESGRIRTEGKDYVMEEGDVTEFLISNS